VHHPSDFEISHHFVSDFCLMSGRKSQSLRMEVDLPLLGMDTLVISHVVREPLVARR
jgi:hypothetical protein